MERLTFEGNFCDIAQCQENPCPYNGSCSQRETWERLKQYEGTGLTPEDCAEYRKFEDEIIASGKTFERLVELLKADKEGRVVDYKLGDTVYDCFGMAWTVTTAEIHVISGELRYLYRCGHDGTNDYCALWRCEILTREEAEEALRRAENG